MMQDISSKMKILITFANTYDMPAEAGRDGMKGCSVHYFFFGEQGEALEPFKEWDVALPVGYQRNKVSLDYAIRAKIPMAPGIYMGDFRMVTGGDGKPVLKLTDVEFIEPLNIKDLMNKTAAHTQPDATGNTASKGSK